MPNQAQNPNSNKVYDLESRTANFGIDVLKFCKRIPKNSITNPLISQLVRSATSIGANYMEADGAESKKDFYHKIGISKKEAKETMHWLRMIAEIEEPLKDECIKLWKEVHELALIFSTIINKGKL